MEFYNHWKILSKYTIKYYWLLLTRYMIYIRNKIPETNLDKLRLLCICILGSQLKNSLPATEFDNLVINIELHSRTIKSVHSV